TPLVLAAQAEGYLTVQSEVLEAGQTNYDFQLRRGTGPAGVVVRPDGKPAAGATVVYLTAMQQGNLSAAGKLSASGNEDGFALASGQTRTADAEGRFSFAPQ